MPTVTVLIVDDQVPFRDVARMVVDMAEVSRSSGKPTAARAA
ncbi:hypothetical protein BH24ACT9_BH24ACT9_18260 [soil metagenome]